MKTPAPRPSARQVIERIQKQVGVPWTEPTVDTFKAGDPDALVTGIAVTMMATHDVLRRAAASGKNLILTHEPTFYDHQDNAEPLEKESDAVLAAKQALIRRHGLIVWRFHDYWHQRQPDGILTGMVRALGWERYRVPGSDARFAPPPMSLTALAASIQKRMAIPTLRVVGNPNLRVTGVGLAPGFAGFETQRRLLQHPQVQALAMGEAHEWETIEYVADAAAQGKPKALIVLGHIPSEQAGMDECARWLKTFVPEVPIAFLPTADPFWTPRSSAR